jgi:hypothetical protein
MKPDPETGPRSGRFALLVVVGAVLVAATVAATWHVSQRRTAQSPLAAFTVSATADVQPPWGGATNRPPTAATAASGPTASAATGDGCPVGPVSMAVPTSLPYSATYGPFRQSTVGLPECFGHSPMGAVIAAWTTDADLFSTGWRQALATQVAKTAGYPRLLTELEATPPDGTPGVDSPAGFTVVAANADIVTVDLILQGAGNGGLIGCPLTMSWDGGDWQLDPRPDGTLTTTPCPAVDPGTFVTWGP